MSSTPHFRLLDTFSYIHLRNVIELTWGLKQYLIVKRNYLIGKMANLIGNSRVAILIYFEKWNYMPKSGKNIPRINPPSHMGMDSHV